MSTEILETRTKREKIKIPFTLEEGRMYSVQETRESARSKPDYIYLGFNKDEKGKVTHGFAKEEEGSSMAQITYHTLKDEDIIFIIGSRVLIKYYGNFIGSCFYFPPNEGSLMEDADKKYYPELKRKIEKAKRRREIRKQ